MARPLPSAVPSNRLPIDDGVTKYRLRNRDWSHVWGEGLAPGEAYKLRDKITAEKRNQGQSMVITPMSEPVPGREAESDADDLSIPAVAELPPPASPSYRTEYRIASDMAPTTLAADGVITSIPLGHQLLIGGQDRQIPTSVQKGDVVECRSMNPAAAQARGAAAAAVSAVIQGKRRVPLDVTVKQPKPRVAPPPPDRTMSRDPVVVRLGSLPDMPAKPLPSPQKVAELEDGEPMAPDAISDAELPDLAGDLGGGPSDADVEHAKKQAEAERAG